MTTTCPTCSNNQFKEYPLTLEIVVKQCLSCELLISRIRRTEPVESEFTRINDPAYHQAISIVRLKQAQLIVPFAKRHVVDGINWLDIGCSFGHLLNEAKSAGYDIFGIEPDDKAYEHARKLLGNEFIYHGYMTDATRPDNSANIISMLDVLEHIPSEELSDFAHMIHRKLTPNGLWIIKVPSTDGLYFKIAHRLSKIIGPFMSGIIKRLWQSDYEFPHTVYFNQRTLKLFLENHGFKVVTCQHLDEVPNSTVLNRLLMDDTIPRLQAFLIAPMFYLINLVEKLRGKSDALLMLAQSQYFDDNQRGNPGHLGNEPADGS